MNSKYLKYAIGEIVLVVLGILIALSINTWNENRKENNLSKVYLDRIEQDLHQLINRSNALSKQNKSILEAITTTQTYLERGTPLSDEELKTVEYAMLWFPRTTYQLPHMLTYEEMKESGNINLIYRQELRTELAEFYSYLAQVESIYIKLGQQVEDQFVIYNRYIRSTTDPTTLDITFEYDFDKMSRDDEFINTFSRLAIHWRGFVFFMEGINQRGDYIMINYFTTEE
ncbi:MAG: hypothetical protein HWE21_11860 [Cytophagia bacterium]|nr:hypothetical protein [Cytophagia bacterium]